MFNEVNISLSDIEAQFMEFLRLNGCEPEGNFSLQIDSKLHRFRIHGDNHGEKTGAYCVFSEGWPAGWCQNWRMGEAVSWHFDRGALNDDLRRSIDDKKYAELLEKSRIHQEKLRKEIAQKQVEASERARTICEQLPNLQKEETHPYIAKKKICAYGLKINSASNTLVVPITNIDGQIINLQWIDEDGEKRFLQDAPVKGNFWSVALDHVEQKEVIFIGEGVATMSTVYELTGQPCVAAMNCGNIKPVAEVIKAKYPNNKIVIIADNDHKGKFNTGKEAAEKVNEELHLAGVLMPDFTDEQDGTDWNDFYVMHSNRKDCEEYVKGIMRQKMDLLPAFNKRLKYRAMAEKLGLLDAELVTTFCDPLPGANFLIEDWIPTESLMMMFAPSGSGKGFVAVDLAYAIASPEINEWHGKKVNKHGPVVYLAGEGQKGLRKRCAGITEYKGISKKKTQLAVIKEALPLNDPNPDSGINRMIANIGVLYPDPQLIIIDTTNRYMLGDENKTPDATSLIQAATKLMNEFRCSVLIIHHTGLSPETQGRARGSSVFKAAMDMEFRISKSGMFITLEMTKSKDTEIQKPLVFEMMQVAAPNFFTDAGFQDTTCVLKHNEEISEAVSNEKKRGQGEKMTKTERFARETYREAAIEHGRIVQDDNSARTVVAVSVEDWRKVAYMRSSADNPATLRTQFNRARAALLEDKKIVSKQIIDDKEYYCLTKTGDDYELGIINSIKENYEPPEDDIE